MAEPGATVFPLLQTVQVADNGTLRPSLNAMSGGATLTLDRSASRATFNIADGALEVSNVVLTKTPTTVYHETSGSTVIRLDFDALDWTAFGSWSVYPDRNPNGHYSEFVTGFQTPGTAVPTSGSATYDGVATGNGGYLSGTAKLQTDFGARTVTGTLTDMRAGDWDSGYLPWNTVSLSASFASGQSRFSGTTAVTSAPGNDRSLGAGAVGTVLGSFFGPNAQEVGAVWTLFDGTRSAVGTIGAAATGP